MERNVTCFFCNTLIAGNKKQSFNIFKTIVHPLERRASDLIADILDINIPEDEVHSNVSCRECFKMVNEFADLESRAAEIRTNMLNNYNNTLSRFEEEKVETEVLEDDNEIEEGGEIVVDADKLNEMVAQSGNSGLKNFLVKNEDGTIERPKLLVVKEGHYEEIDLSEIGVLGDVGAEEEEEDDDGEGQDTEEGSVETLDDGLSAIVSVADKEHICRLCPLGGGNIPFSVDTANMNLMILHMRHEHNTRLYTCAACGSGYKNRSELNIHEVNCGAPAADETTCNLCDRSFTNARLLKIHKRTHTVHSKAWRCSMCEKSFNSRNLLEEHVNAHLGVRPHKCSTCGKTFASKYTFKAHLKIHEDRERCFGCPKCDKAFLSQAGLFQHIKTHSNAYDFNCGTCGKQFRSHRSLEVHQVVHTGVKPFSCKDCGKSFARKAEILDHERIHTGEKPFTCDICSAQFSQRSNLQSHRRVTHFNDRRYSCELCTKTFKRRRLLDYHVKAAHTGERPYTCETCDATFVYPEHFKKHVRIHTGDKPFKCEVCDKAFNSRDNRNAHRFVHSDKKPYECLYCGVGFMRKPLLYAHMQQAGHQNDTIVVNQPRLDTDEEEENKISADGDYQLTIVDENNTPIRHIVRKPKGDKKTLLQLDDGQAITTDDADDSQMIDENGMVDFDGNIISVEQFEEEEGTMTAHINEKGQLVNEHGDIISEDAQALLMEGAQIGASTESESDEVSKSEISNNVQYVQIEVADAEHQNWMNVIKQEDSECSMDT